MKFHNSLVAECVGLMCTLRLCPYVIGKCIAQLACAVISTSLLMQIADLQANLPKKALLTFDKQLAQ